MKTLTTAFDIDFGVVDCSACGILASPERLARVLLVLGESLAVFLYFDHVLVGLIAVATGGLGQKVQARAVSILADPGIFGKGFAVRLIVRVQVLARLTAKALFIVDREPIFDLASATHKHITQRFRFEIGDLNIIEGLCCIFDGFLYPSILLWNFSYYLTYIKCTDIILL